VDDGWVWNGVERWKPGSGSDGTVKEHLVVDDRLWCGSGWDLLGPEVCREEETFVCREVVVDSETTLSEEHVS